MKFSLAFLFLLLTSLGFSQNTINGIITDAELENAPLMFAKITLKETGTKLITDETGAFTFNNLDEGRYTLVCSFTGYETKEISIDTKEVNTSLSIPLFASTLSLDDLTLAFASATVVSPKNNTEKSR